MGISTRAANTTVLQSRRVSSEIADVGSEAPRGGDILRGRVWLQVNLPKKCSGCYGWQWVLGGRWLRSMTTVDGCFARTDSAGIGKVSAGSFAISMGARASAAWSPSARSNWRCLAVDKLLQVELLQGSWHTAPNYSRPQTCIAQVEMDVEDQPEDAPQKGQ